LVRLKSAGLGRGKSARSAADGSLPSGADEILRWIRQVVARVNDLESEAQQCSEDGLRARTSAYRGRLVSGEAAGALLPEAFATVCEASRRTIGLCHHDVQIMGGAVLHLGKIAEMRTGEGKTLTATLPAYLAALGGQSVHLMTAIEYLAGRDFAWMQPVFEMLGLTVGLLRAAANPDRAVRRLAYAADVTYGTFTEFSYDFLRDNLAWETTERVQRGLDLAIVDEADLILVDEMRATPQISGPEPKPSAWTKELAAVAARLRPGVDYTADLQARQVGLTDQGIDRVEDWFGVANLYDERNITVLHMLENALKAKELYARDRDYTIAGTEVVVLDALSGRPRPRVRYGDGVHEAIEAKEEVPLHPAGQILASVSECDYLSQYAAIAGMTGTAVSDAKVYRDIYELDVVPIPTNKPMIRVDHPDVLYKTRQAKLTALASDAARRQAAGQPVLIGTMSADDAQVISGLLSEAGATHEMLSARNHEREAEILVEAGRPGAITVVVKMAGRGVDIELGGAQGTRYETVADAGGLCVLGAERPVSRRMELHLRGRAGRQGDPGESRFYLSAEDEVVKAIVKAALVGWLADGTQLRALTTAVDKVQARTAESQAAWLSQTVAYDDVLAQQQRLVYADRRAVLELPDLRPRVVRMIDDLVQSGALAADAASEYARREAELGAPVMRTFERKVLLSVTDRAWRDHLAAMTDLLTGLAARSAGRTPPLPDYQREGGRIFDAMTARLRQQSISMLLTAEIGVK
jgi:preprotein translocase subunit SecA